MNLLQSCDVLLFGVSWERHWFFTKRSIKMAIEAKSFAFVGSATLVSAGKEQAERFHKVTIGALEATCDISSGKFHVHHELSSRVLVRHAVFCGCRGVTGASLEAELACALEIGATSFKGIVNVFLRVTMFLEHRLTNHRASGLLYGSSAAMSWCPCS